MIDAIIESRYSGVIAPSLQHKRRAEQEKARAEQEKASARLNELHGMRHAITWGKSLVEDIALFKAKRIRWSEVDRGLHSVRTAWSCRRAR